MNTQLILALCFSLAAVICNVVALVSSAWLGTYGQTSVGLFEMCMEGKCFSMFAMHTLMGDIAKAVTALVVVAVLLLILGIFLIICACTRNDVKLTRLSSIIILLSGVIALSGAATFSVGVLLSQKDPGSLMFLTRGSTCTYSFVLAWMGALLAMVAAVLGLTSCQGFSCCRQKKKVFGNYEIQLSAKHERHTLLPSTVSLIPRKGSE
ncbi:uncharacterized protein LOC143465969 [Clavelina lepadiformis]|uniref:uncharacterized protein LOC143465969 n=1 Tax=Clavelina lepadiformis TaxID=159417 RepID=UPI004040FA31